METCSRRSHRRPGQAKQQKTHNNMFGSDLCTISAHHDCTETNGNKWKLVPVEATEDPANQCNNELDRNAAQCNRDIDSINLINTGTVRTSLHPTGTYLQRFARRQGNRNKRKQTETNGNLFPKSGALGDNFSTNFEP